MRAFVETATPRAGTFQPTVRHDPSRPRAPQAPAPRSATVSSHDGGHRVDWVASRTDSAAYLRAGHPISERVNTYRAALGQMLVEGGKPEANIRRAISMVRAAAKAGCAVVVLPECIDFGWTHPVAVHRAHPIPGAHSERISAAAQANRIHVVVGLVERVGERLYNASVLFNPLGELVLKHRKINEVEAGLGLYAIGDRLEVAATELGRVAIPICADNLWDSRVIGHALCRMGAQVILSPSAWAVVPEHDESAEPYGDDWIPTYTELASLYGVTVIGVSNVGAITAGPSSGRLCIGKSLAVGPGGRILATGAYGVTAEQLVIVDVMPQTVPVLEPPIDT